MIRRGELNSLISANGLTQRFVQQGGYEQIEKEQEVQIQREERKKRLELELAESTISANHINAQNSKFNRFATIVNILIGMLNIGLLIYQLITAK